MRDSVDRRTSEVSGGRTLRKTKRETTPKVKDVGY